MRRIAALFATSMLASGLAACGSDGDSATVPVEPQSRTDTAGATPSPSLSGEEAPTDDIGQGALDGDLALVNRVQAYFNALFAGDGARAVKYIKPTCSAADRTKQQETAQKTAAFFPGVKIIVESVKVRGKSGTVGKYNVLNASPQAEQLLSNGTSAHDWFLVDGEWYTTCDAGK